ncbi:MAG: hypothetical protein H6573_33905 [Lewinellaceae bacterium]|nr:hypothetical protein [Lewinellaceae bacterium]
MINLSDTLALEKMPIVGARAIGVLVAISKFMNEHNQAWPSRKTLRALTGLGRDALDKDISLLEKHRLAKKSQRRSEGGRRLSSNCYTIPRSLARKYTPLALCNNAGQGCSIPPGQVTVFQGPGSQDTEIQGCGPQLTDSQDTDFQDTGSQHPENSLGSIEYSFEVLNKKEVLNKQEALSALYARACEEAEKLKLEKNHKENNTEKSQIQIQIIIYGYVDRRVIKGRFGFDYQRGSRNFEGQGGGRVEYFGADGFLPYQIPQ